MVIEENNVSIIDAVGEPMMVDSSYQSKDISQRDIYENEMVEIKLQKNLFDMKQQYGKRVMVTP